MSINANSWAGALIAAGMALLTSLASAEPAGDPIDVDLELVLAADRSASMSRLMLVRQRTGFAEAFQDARLRKMVNSGPLGRIAAVYVEWSDASDQHVVFDWNMVV